MRSLRAILAFGSALLCVLAVTPHTASATHVFWHSAPVLGAQQDVFAPLAPQDRCPSLPSHLPGADLNVRVFKDAFGRNQMILPWQTNTRLLLTPGLMPVPDGPDAGTRPDGVDCTPVMTSSNDPRPEQFNDSEWLAAPYIDGAGAVVYGLVHNEYRPWEASGRCPRGVRRDDGCWNVSITSAWSYDLGESFSNTAPGHMVATVPSRYIPGIGYQNLMEPSNIIRRAWGAGADHKYYALVQAILPHDVSAVCVMRTDSIHGPPPSWLAWDGSDFTIRFRNPYTETPDRACKPIARNEISSIKDSIAWSTYYDKYVLVGSPGYEWKDPKEPGHEQPDGERTDGIYLALSDDLVHWTRRHLVSEVTDSSCRPARISLLDPDVTDPGTPQTRNYEVVDQNAYLYALSNCAGKDVVRMPIEFKPIISAAIDKGAERWSVGAANTFTAASSRDPGSAIPAANHKWDLDDDFVCDDASGKSVSHTFREVGEHTVRLCLTDDTGGVIHRTWTTVLVNAKVNVQPTSSPVPSGYQVDAGQAYAAGPGNRGYGWVLEDSLEGGHVPVDLTRNTADRPDPNAYDDRQDTFLFMQPPPLPAVPTRTHIDGAWEIAAQNGLYTVTVSVGDALQYDMTGTSAPWTESSHRINVEGETALVFPNPSASDRIREATVIVEVTDGRVTVDARGGSNTKLNYVDIASNNSRPAAQFNALPNPAFRGETVTFNASMSYRRASDGRFGTQDDGDAIQKYEWDFNGDGVFDESHAASSTAPAQHWATHTYASAGTRTAVLRVTDSEGATEVVSNPVKVAQGVNFAPETVTAPSNYLTDVGQAYPSSDQLDIFGAGHYLDVQPTSYTQPTGPTGPWAPYPGARCRPPQEPAPPTSLPAHAFDPGIMRCFGWVTQASVQSAPHDPQSHVKLDLSANAQDRTRSPAKTQNNLLDSFIYMQAPPTAQAGPTKTNGAWEIPVAPGRYEVTVSVGDPNQHTVQSGSPPWTISSHRVRVEDTIAVDLPSPSATNRFASGTVTVDVTDGRLTLDAIGGSNTKPNYVDIKRTG